MIILKWFWIEDWYAPENPEDFERMTGVAQHTNHDGVTTHYYWNNKQKKWIKTTERNVGDREKILSKAIYYDVFTRAEKNNWSQKQIDRAIEKRKLEHEEEQIRREIFK